MALTRKMLKAMGIEEEKIDQIIEAHSETTDALKAERDEYKADAEKLADVQKKLDKANETIAKQVDGEVVPKSDYDKIKKEYDDYKAGIDAEKTHSAKETAYRELLKAAGVSDKRISAVVKVTDIDGIELDKDGKIKDADERTNNIKTEWADFIETTTTHGAKTANPPANNGKGTGKTKEEILAIKDGALRRQEMAANPHLFGLDKD
jgi:sulfur carrier protein ThiS